MNTLLPRGLLVFAAFGVAAMSSPVCMAITRQLPPPFCGTQEWEPFIAEAASRTAIPQAWIRAVMLAESAGCAVTDGVPTTSASGAMGLMQIMPATWTSMRPRLRLGPDPYDPHDNILAAAAVLQELCNRYGSPGCIAAYHAGAQRFEEYLRGGRQLPAVTLDYVARVQRWVARADTRTPATTRGVDKVLDSQFAARDLFEPRRSASDGVQRNGPFVPLMRNPRDPDQDRGGQPHVQSP